MARSIYFLAGLGYGDEGKGATVDALAYHLGASLVVRFNGGAQCGHHVMTPAGRTHCFAQFGSGTFLGRKTHLSQYMMVNPITLMSEALGLQQVGVESPFQLLTIDEQAPVTTPFHMAANRLRETLRGAGRHGSCGMGIGETAMDVLAYQAIKAIDLQDEDFTRAFLHAQQKRKAAEFREALEKNLFDPRDPNWKVLTDEGAADRITANYRQFVRLVRIVPQGWLQAHLRSDGPPVIFEGAQGVLLDQDYGWHPYTTWSDTTFGNADKLIEGTGITPVRLGVLRAHMTRHGAGPFVTETPSWNPDGDHNQEGAWQGRFRYGHLDLEALRYSLQVIGRLDGLCVTHLDQPSTMVCGGYMADKKPLPQIKPFAKPYLAGQGMLTDLLMTAKPILFPMPGHDVAENISYWLAAPLFSTSNGPTRDHFRLHHGRG